MSGNKLPEQVSAISPLHEAIDGSRRTVQPRQQHRSRSRSALREVTSGIICFCGEQFSETQALEFMLHLRAEVGADLQTLKKMRTDNAAYMRRKRASDPEWRAAKNAATRARYLAKMAGDPEWAAAERARKREQFKKRYANPEVRAQRKIYAREYDRKLRADPEYNERRNARRRQLRAVRNDESATGLS